MEDVTPELIHDDENDEAKRLLRIAGRVAGRSIERQKRAGDQQSKRKA
jgi:hypothetical protein